MPQHLLVIPIVTKAIAFAVSAALIAWAWMKRRAIAGIIGASAKGVESTFWRWAAKRIYAALPPPVSEPISPANQRTYRGVFVRYAQFATFPKDYFFEIEQDGETQKVSVEGTHFLEDLQPGDFVKIETLTGANKYAEIVQRVAKGEKLTKPRGPLAQGPAGY
jgi:hypothetical protein